MKRIGISWFQVFKYSIYLLLSYNIYLFLQDDLASSSAMFSDGPSLKDIILVFSGTIDTLAWVLLLAIFELETYVIEDEKIKGGLKWFLKAIAVLCYIFIVYSFYGYLKKYLWFSNFQITADISAVCNYIGHSWMVELDEFTTITIDNCNALSDNSQLFILSEENIITDSSALKNSKNVALIDIFNSCSWLIVVLVLEIDIWLQHKNKLKGNIKKISTGIKVIAYIVLLGAAITWATYGVLLDLWDASLWILAFVFIEMNILKMTK